MITLLTKIHSFNSLISKPTTLEICAGAGGQALGLELAGFEHLALVEIDKHCCNTLRQNRPHWNVLEQDVRLFDGTPFHEQIDLLAGGVPCPPFSVASKQLGESDERNLVPELLRLTQEIMPKVVLLENVPGLMRSKFDDYRSYIDNSLKEMGYQPEWKILNACDYGVPQLRPRAIMVAIHKTVDANFIWPQPSSQSAPTVSETLYELMASKGWIGVNDWAVKANQIAPTIVGGSKKTWWA